MDIGILQDFGLAASVIAALFYMMNKFLEDMQNIRKEHAEERQLWLDAQKQMLSEVKSALHELTNAIEKQNSRYRKEDER